MVFEAARGGGRQPVDRDRRKRRVEVNLFNFTVALNDFTTDSAARDRRDTG